MRENHKGFSHIVLPVLLLIVLVGIGIFAYNRVIQDVKQDKLVHSENYRIQLKAKSDSSYVYQYSISVGFVDSVGVNRESGCDERLEDFRGALNIEYQSDDKAKLDILQNIKPKTHEEEGSISYALCPAVIVSGFSDSVQLDKEWLESGASNKTLQINGRIHKLTVDKRARLIHLSDNDHTVTVDTQPYLPDGLALLYSHPAYSNCKSIAELQRYAEQHDIVSAYTKFPDLSADLEAIPGLVVGKPYGSENFLLVVANDHVKQLVKKTSNEKGVNDNCRVVASKPTYTFVSR